VIWNTQQKEKELGINRSLGFAQPSTDGEKRKRREGIRREGKDKEVRLILWERVRRDGIGNLSGTRKGVKGLKMQIGS